MTQETHPEFAIDHLKERIAELEKQLASTEDRYDLAMRDSKRLEKQLDLRDETLASWKVTMDKAEKREAVLREALEFYGMESNYSRTTKDDKNWDAEIEKDKGAKARAALEVK